MQFDLTTRQKSVKCSSRCCCGRSTVPRARPQRLNVPTAAYHRVRSESQTFIGAILDFAIACSGGGRLSNAAGSGSASPPLANNSARTSSGVLERYWSLLSSIMPERTPFCSLSGGRGMGPCAAPALNQTGEPSGKTNLASEARLPSTRAATSAGASRTSIICNQSILAFAPFLFSVEMVFRIRITVFGGSLPSDPSGKVNFTNERGVVSLVAWPEAAGEVAARYRPRGKTQPQTANKRFMVCAPSYMGNSEVLLPSCSCCATTPSANTLMGCRRAMSALGQKRTCDRAS